VHLLIAYFYFVWHIENVGQDFIAIEAEAQEEQLPESEVAAEEQELETDFANPDLQQGKHQINSTQCPYIKV